MSEQDDLAGTLMLCQDCERVAEYSEAGHLGEDLCSCGGEFCGCPSCQQTAADQTLKEKKKA